ncbi:MAG TPA: protealysin inhibitor emfourin [Nitrososphaeraceae archaeon]|nr:protealysin inhibitor emfourin [Nitrososphaeraceae archaeon]
MLIKVEKSGGILGSSRTIEIDGKDLPPTLIRVANKIMADQKPSYLLKRTTLAGAADHFFYRISIVDGENNKVVECNELNARQDLKKLIKFLEKNSKKEK